MRYIDLDRHHSDKDPVAGVHSWWSIANHTDSYGIFRDHPGTPEEAKPMTVSDEEKVRKDVTANIDIMIRILVQDSMVQWLDRPARRANLDIATETSQSEPPSLIRITQPLALILLPSCDLCISLLVDSRMYGPDE